MKSLPSTGNNYGFNATRPLIPDVKEPGRFDIEKKSATEFKNPLPFDLSRVTVPDFTKRQVELFPHRLLPPPADGHVGEPLRGLPADRPLRPHGRPAEKITTEPALPVIGRPIRNLPHDPELEPVRFSSLTVRNF